MAYPTSHDAHKKSVSELHEETMTELETLVGSYLMYSSRDPLWERGRSKVEVSMEPVELE